MTTSVKMPLTVSAIARVTDEDLAAIQAARADYDARTGAWRRGPSTNVTRHGLEAFARLANRRKNAVQLTIIGDGPLFDQTVEPLRAYLEKSAEFFTGWPLEAGQAPTSTSIPGYNYDMVSGVDYVIDAVAGSSTYIWWVIIPVMMTLPSPSTLTTSSVGVT